MIMDIEIVRAISIRQPYVEAILNGEKTIEYRSRKTNIRERVYIYASKTLEDEETFQEFGYDSSKCPTGAIVGSVKIVGCTYDSEYDCYEWHLKKPERLHDFLKPANQPQPGIWRPQFSNNAVSNNKDQSADKDLTMSIPNIEGNFSFLQSEWPDIAKVADLAEKSLYFDPGNTLSKLRIFLEKVVIHIFKYEDMYEYENMTLNERLKNLCNSRIFPGSVNDAFHLVKNRGNIASHDLFDSPKEAYNTLKVAFNIARWFYLTYAKDQTVDVNNLSYIKPEYQNNSPESIKKQQAEYEALAKYSEDLAKEIEELKAQKLTVRKSNTSISEKFEIPHSEEDTRALIDLRLQEAGWTVDTDTIRYPKVKPEKGKNYAIAEWPCGTGKVDYALFCGLTLVGLIEAKKYSTDISTVLTETKQYAMDLVTVGDEELIMGAEQKYKAPFLFATNGRDFLSTVKEKSGIWLLDARKSTNLPRPVNSWFSPQDLLEKIQKGNENPEEKLRELSTSFLKSKEGLNLRYYQVEAIESVEGAVLENKKSALLEMATGTGKTRTAIGLIYRLLKTNMFRRILFLVDRRSLGDQAADSFRDVKVENLQTLFQIYDIKELKDKSFELDTRIQVATVQSMVKRLMSGNEAQGATFTTGVFDCIIVDEAHRGYLLDTELSEEELTFKNQEDYISKYRYVLDYFDAFAVALTATPALHTRQIFGDPVYQYHYRQAVIDGNLVDHDTPYHIETELSRNGIKFEAGTEVKTVNDKQQKYGSKTLDDELDFEIEAFNRKVITENFNRAVLSKISELIDPFDPGKTLIFAATEEHAKMVERIMREVYVESGVELDGDAVLKITGTNKYQDKDIRRFKTDDYPKFVVTVDLLTTGIDVPEICNIVFLRRVRSRILYEQMLGRATRLCPQIGKEKFNIYDAVGIYDALEPYTDMAPVAAGNNLDWTTLVDECERLKELKSDIPKEEHIQDQTDRVVARLQRMKTRIDTSSKAEHFTLHSDGLSAEEYTEKLLKQGPEERIDTIIKDRELFEFIQNTTFTPPVETGAGLRYISNHEDKVIDVSRGYGEKNQKPADYLESFSEFIKENEEKVAALSILKTSPHTISRAELKELYLTLDTHGFTEIDLNNALKETKKADILADIITLIKQEIDGTPLVSHERRIKNAVARAHDIAQWGPAQQKWLERIEKQLLRESVLQEGDFAKEPFKSQGGYNRIDKIFDGKLGQVLQVINAALYDYS